MQVELQQSDQTADTTGNMAAGPGAASSGHSGGRASSGGFEASLDRRFQGISNTMDSIQGLCSWCIENKKHHSLIVRYWLKWLKKSDAAHRLNLFYLANDVIQNCKRKNAIVFRSSFAEVLPGAALLVKDAKVHKSVERIFTIWQERNVYSEELITELKTNLVKKEPPPPAAPPVNPKTALKSKVVAEFAPQAFIDQLSSHQRILEETDLRQKQMAALRVDVCNLNSAEALKRLKDKAGGNKFSTDFEDGSSKLQEFVTFLEGQMNSGPPLLEALSNADIFYEMQYKEVKIVANAYKTFANRVSNLKRKLDALRGTLPDPDDSPIPSPSEDAPSPTGSESPFHGLIGSRGGHDHPELDRRGKDLQSDNRDVEDMDLSEEEEEEQPAISGIIVEERKEKPSASTVSKTTTAPPPAASKLTSTAANPTKAPAERSANQTPPSSTAPTQTTPTMVSGPSPLQVNLANVDLGKISSILSSITSAMKGSGVSPAPRPSPTTPTTPSSQSTPSKTPVPAPATPPAANPLASILSRVDITPEGILSALSKTKGHSPGLQGLSSYLHSVSGTSTGSQSTTSASTSTPQLSSSSTVTTATATASTTAKTKPSSSLNSLKRDLERERMREWEKVREREREKEREKEREREREREKEKEKERDRERERERERANEAAAAAMPSLDSKIHTFLQGNPAFSEMGLGLDDGDPTGSPLLVGDNADGTPVRDEAASTPTQDEIMDTPEPSEVHGRQGESQKSQALSGRPNLSPTAYRSDLWDAVINPRELLGDVRPKDGDYRPNALRHPTFPPASKKAAKPSVRPKEDEPMMKRKAPVASSSSLEQKVKVSRKASLEEGRPVEAEEKGKRGGKEVAPSGGGERQQYHRIETVVSSNCGEGTPIQTLDSGFRRLSGERIQTVESIRVIGRGMRRGGGVSARGPESWYEEQAFMEDASESANERSGGGLGLPPSPALHMPPPPHPHMPQGAYQPPYSNEDPHQRSHTHPHPQAHAHTHPHTLPHQHQHQHQQRPQMPPHPPGSHFFPPSLPPIPQRPPPPIPQLPPPPREFMSTTSAVMVGGVLVPIDRILPNPPSNTTRSEGAERGGAGGPPQNRDRVGKSPTTPLTPRPLMSSLLGDPPPLPRPGTVKEHFTPRHTPPLHRPGAPGVPPPLLGHVKEGPGPSPPPTTTPSSSAPSSPADPQPLLPNRLPTPNQSPRTPTSPSPQPRNHRRPPSPSSHLRLPSLALPLRPPLPTPPQRPNPRGQTPFLLRTPPFERKPLFTGGKRPAFGGNQGTAFPPKRPFLPPRY